MNRPNCPSEIRSSPAAKGFAICLSRKLKAKSLARIFRPVTDSLYSALCFIGVFLILFHAMYYFIRCFATPALYCLIHFRLIPFRFAIRYSRFRFGPQDGYTHCSENAADRLAPARSSPISFYFSYVS